MKSEKSPFRFVSWLDILDIKLCLIPYILFKLKEIKKSEVISTVEHTKIVACTNVYSRSFSL